MHFAPLSSPKEKHLKMNDKIDFLKIDKGKLGAINFNNMVPVFEKNIINIKLNSKNKYDRLLMNQLKWINENREKIYKKSMDLYIRYINDNLDKKIIDRCCNFKLLELKCQEYNKNNVKVNS